MKAPILFLVPVATLAQLAFYTVDGTGEQVVQGLVNAGTAFPGDRVETRLRVRNTGATAVTLQSLRLAGAGFSLQNTPVIPYVMAPGLNVDFRVRFEPPAWGTYNATVQANEKTIIVRGEAPQAPSLWVEQNGAPAVVSSAAPLSFGRAERGELVDRRLFVRNDTTAAQTVQVLEVSGIYFSRILDRALPVRLDPGETVAFGVRFAALRAGAWQGTLRVDARTIPLEGVAVDPPFPEARITLSSSTVASGQQVKLSVPLALPSRTAGTGTLTLAFQPAAGAPDDPGVQFLPAGARSVRLTVAENDNVARWNGNAEGYLQTGTTAGTITVRLELGEQKQETVLAVSAAPVRMDQVRVVRSAGGVEVQVSGFDNTRGVSALGFTFFERGGRAILAPPAPEAAEIFSRYFRDSRVGGMFLLRAFFPVMGDAALLGAVEVEMRNPAGAAKSDKATF